MRRIALATVALIIGVVACQEVATSPESTATASLDPRYAAGNPPPPPIDTGAQVSVGPDAASYRGIPQRGFSIRLVSALQEGCSGSPSDFIIPVTYMYDPAGNTGWLHVTDNPFDSLDASANGMVRMRADAFGVQSFTGKGKIAIVIDGCTFVVDLATVTEQSHFGECSIFEDITPEAQPTRDQGCFFLYFSGVLLNNQDIGDATLTPTEECTPEDERPACDPFIPNLIDNLLIG